MGEEVRLNVPEGFVSLTRDRFLLIARREWAEAAEHAGAFTERDPGRWNGASPPLRKGRGGVVPVELQGGPARSVIVKPLLRGGILRRLNHDLHISPGRLVHEAKLSVILRRHRVPAGDMAFGRAERICGPLCRLHLATVRIEAAVPLLDFLRDAGAAAEEAMPVLRAAGECVRALHDAGVLHADLNLGNLLVVPGGEGLEPGVRVIDLDGSRFGPSLRQKGRAANLARLLRHAVKNNLHADADLEGAGRWFMEGYCGESDPVPLRRRVIRVFRRTLPLHRISWRLQGITVPTIPFGS